MRSLIFLDTLIACIDRLSPPPAIAPSLNQAFPNYDTTSGYGHDRHSPQPQHSYGSYTTSSRATPPLMTHADPRSKLPPLSTSPGPDRQWAQSTGYGVPAGHSYHPRSGNTIYSPTASHPNQFAGYSTSNQGNTYTYMPTYDQLPMNPPSLSFDDIEPSHLQPRSTSPYGRVHGSSHGVSNYAAPSPGSPTSPEEPTAQKKKRKRADAAQLKVLNETYARTAFPSTEERHALAKALDMTARSVQIW